jgi:hypothetical protein
MIRWLILAQIRQNDLKVPKTPLTNSSVDDVLKLVFGFAGAVALIIIVLGGFKYVISQGNPQETAKAKNTIIYAIIGLVVCLAAFSIISFVIQGVT